MTVANPVGMGEAALQPHLQEARRYARRGLWVLFGGLFPVLAWLAFAPLYPLEVTEIGRDAALRGIRDRSSAVHETTVVEQHHVAFLPAMRIGQ